MENGYLVVPEFFHCNRLLRLRPYSGQHCASSRRSVSIHFFYPTPRLAPELGGERPSALPTGAPAGALSVAEAVADFNRENSVKLWTITVV
jgi:hypothetical protein